MIYSKLEIYFNKFYLYNRSEFLLNLVPQLLKIPLV